MLPRMLRLTLCTLVFGVLAGLALMFVSPANLFSQRRIAPSNQPTSVAPHSRTSDEAPASLSPVVQASIELDNAHHLAIVFVSRQIPPNGSIYMQDTGELPGVGPRSRFRVAAPGKLLIRDGAGALHTLVDGANPSDATLNLIDVNAPDVSYDGTTIVFAGLPDGDHDDGPVNNPGAWRIYRINVDGTNLVQITHSDQELNNAQFGAAAKGLAAYDDTDPAWLPDGRIVFSSTRWPSFAQYSGVRTSNLYVVNADGGALHRITAERNGADRPLVDPVTGKIVYARWWRNHRFPLDDESDVGHTASGFVQRDGLTTDREMQLDGAPEYADALWRNGWQAATINPDGTGLAMWGGSFRDEPGNHVYGGAFTPDGQFVANFFPMFNMTEASGFGGLRRYQRGPHSYTPLVGVTSLTFDYLKPDGPTSFGIFKGTYAAEPDVLPDGRLIFSWAGDAQQDYGLYTANADGSAPTKLYDNAGTSEVRARVLRARPLPPVIGDTIKQVAAPLPPARGKQPDDGTFVFDDLNVYANAPVDTDIVSAPPVGSAQTIRFFLDHQRTSPGSFPKQDWPILLGEAHVSPSGAVQSASPANLPLFEQLRAPDGTVPRTGGPYQDGAAHVAGMNFGRPGEHVRCVGCHAGHSMMIVPASAADAQWSNLAPGAQVSVSSTRDARYNGGLVDRRVLKGEIWRYWTSAPGQAQGQWVQLTFPVPVSVRTVRLYNPRPGEEANASIEVEGATVQLFADPQATQLVAQASASNVAVEGTDVAFEDVRARVVRVNLDAVRGTFYNAPVASLAEIEVIARGEQ